MRDLYPVLDLLDLAVAMSEGLAAVERREAAATVAAAGRRRRTLFSDAVVVAIAGGTGSGKSSLLNAIAGETIAATSPLRPHTDEPLAWVPEGDEPIITLLNDLGITSIVEHRTELGLAIVDLPDLDSLDTQHRAIVERILPHADAVIWIFDPVKYHDPSIHEEFLADLAAYGDVFEFVLNKTDRLDEGEAEAVATHLAGLLEQDGFEEPTLWRVAADPPEAPPAGIEALTEDLVDRLVVKRADQAKLVKDILRAGRDLVADIGAWSGIPDDANNRIREAASDRAQLDEVLSDLGIGGPLADELAAAGEDPDAVDRVLRRKGELAATVAALGVMCAEIDAFQRRGG